MDGEVFEEMWNLFKEFKDKAWSFMDCTSFTVIKKSKLREILSNQRRSKETLSERLVSIRDSLQ